MKERLEPASVSAPTSVFSERHRLWIAAVSLAVGVGLLVWHGPLPLEGLIHKLAERDAWGSAGVTLAANPATLRHYFASSIALALFLLGIACLCGVAWTRLSEVWRRRVYDAVFTLSITCAVMIFLIRMTYEGPWAPLKVIMWHPSEAPIFGHRLLFAWLARALQWAVPRISDLQSFYMSQGVATLLALYALRRWSCLFVGRSFSWMGQVLGAVLISICFDYYDFYDVGTVFFTTCALIAIFKRRYWWLVPIMIVGTMNYEGLLLVIPIAIFSAYKEPLKQWLLPVILAFLGYCAVRFALQMAIPLPHQTDLRVWWNMLFPFVQHRQLVTFLMAVGGWGIVGWLSIRYCSPRLKRLMLLFPLLCLTSFLFGKFNEVRLFEAFIPVLTAMILSVSMRRFEADQAANDGSARVFDQEQMG